MATIKDDSRLVQVTLDRADLDAIRDGELVEVECPHTGETIYFGTHKPQPYECECCGQMVEVEDLITPSWRARSLPRRLSKGGTAIYDSAHNEEDITIVVRADHDVAGGWK